LHQYILILVRSIILSTAHPANSQGQAESLISKAAGHFTRAAYDRQAYLSQTAGTVSLPLSKVLTL